MATPVIKLEPIRMGSLVATSSPLSPGQKYIAPGKRSGLDEAVPIKVNLGVDNFPTLGSVPKKAVGWGKHVIKTAPVNDAPPATDVEVLLPPTMRDKIKEQIRQAELEEEEKQKPREDDPYKMTREELLAGGWAVLSMKPECVMKARLSLNTPFTRAFLTSEDYYE
jgi:hypothetical protein